MIKNTLSQSGIKIKLVNRFQEKYDATYDIRRWGSDNLYAQEIVDFAETSPQFASCAQRFADFIYGKGPVAQSSVISRLDIRAAVRDYSILGGFALFVQYNGIGDIIKATHIPIETVRLGERNSQGLCTYCYVCPDWTFSTTNNKRKVDRKDITRYWLFTDNAETRLRRMQSEDYAGGEVLFVSNTKSYPIEKVRSALCYVSGSVGVANILYRDIRTSFQHSTVLAIPRQSDGDLEAFTTNLEHLQGDESSYRILALEYSSSEDKPEALNLQNNSYTDDVLKVSEEIRKNIIRAYNQEVFIRLEEGALGFSADAISDVYRFYNAQVDTDRTDFIRAVQKIDPGFDLIKLDYVSIQ